MKTRSGTKNENSNPVFGSKYVDPGVKTRYGKPRTESNKNHDDPGAKTYCKTQKVPKDAASKNTSIQELAKSNQAHGKNRSTKGFVTKNLEYSGNDIGTTSCMFPPKTARGKTAVPGKRKTGKGKYS